MEFLIFLLVVLGVILLKSIKQINEYERGLLFTFGKFSRILNPGWVIVLPIFQFYNYPLRLILSH